MFFSFGFFQFDYWRNLEFFLGDFQYFFLVPLKSSIPFDFFSSFWKLFFLEKFKFVFQILIISFWEIFFICFLIFSELLLRFLFYFIYLFPLLEEFEFLGDFQSFFGGAGVPLKFSVPLEFLMVSGNIFFLEISLFF